MPLLYNSEEEYWDLQLKIINCAYYIHSSMFVLGLVGNIISVLVILCSKSFHNLTGYYLLSLSSADLFILLMGVSFYVFAQKFEFLSDTAVRYISDWVCETSMIASTWTVTAFTVERYLAICHPFLVQSLSKQSRVKQIIIGIWSICALLALLPTALVIVSHSQGDEEMKATIEQIIPYVADVWSALFFFIPISAIVTMYVLIWIKLKGSSKEKQITAQQQVNRADTRMLMMFVIIVMAFLLSWAPFYIYRLLYMHMVISKYRTVKPSYDFALVVDNFRLVKLVKQITFPLSSALNPIIFSLTSKKFRDALKDLVSNSSRRIYTWSPRVAGSRNNSNTVETTM